MKTIVRLFVIFACMLATVAQAQVTTTITPKVQMFPSSGLSYVEDPTQYFNVIMTNTGPEARQIYVSFRVSCDFSATGGNFFLQSPGNMAPPQPLTLGANETRVITMQDFRMLMSHINGRDIQMSGISWQDALMLPEGNYQICIKTYYWDHAGTVPTPVEAGPEGCCYFTICYSGSAPEFTSPIIGQSGGNINVINPMADQSGSNSNFDASSGSDSRSNSDYTVLTPSRQVVFSWQGVISNCITNSNVNYIFKIVEVMPQQSVYDAIDNNSTIYTVNAGSRTTCIIDTLKDLNATPFQRGHTYAAMVQAVPKNQNMVFRLGNEGKSQIIAFNWGQPLSGPVPRILPPGSNGRTLDSTLSDNKADVLASLRDPYLVMPVVDDDAADVLVGKFPSENANRPQNSLSLIDGLYYRLNDKNKLKVSWLPMRGDSLTKVEYKVNLYEYIGGDVSFSTTRPPLKSYKIEKTNGFGVDNVAFMELPEKWDSVLEHGNKYFLVLEAASHYKYRRTTEYTETVIENGNTTTNKYSKVTVMEGTEFFYSNELFQWGYDSAMLETVDVAQLTYPVDMRGRTGEYGAGETEIEEVFINSSFKFTWTRADNVLDRDSVTYNLLIAKLKKGTLPSKVRDTLLFYKGLTDNEYIDDAIKDSLKVGNQYVAFVETRIKQANPSDDPYIIPNKGRSWTAAFKIVETEELSADNDPSAFCPSESWSKINKKDTLRPKNINDIKGMELTMNGFKVVFQEVKEKTDSIKDRKTKKVTLRKSYYGKGYIVWSPFAMNTRIKVQLDSILFNNDHEVFTGCAKTIAADSTALLPMDFGGKIGDWTEGKINSLYKEVDDNEDVQKYVNYFNKPSYMSIGGLIGAGDAGESPAFFLPLKVNSQDFYLPDDGCNVILSINNMYLSPKTALMNLFTLFYSQEDNIYIPMIATNICMEPDAFFSGFNEGIDMYLAKDIEMEISDGYNMTIKRASKLGKKDDGTVISFRTKTDDKNSGFDQLNLEFQFDLTSADALHHDNRGVLALNPKTGIPQKGTPVRAGALIVIQDWSDWMARISIDPFALEDFPDMAFVPGRNLWYDHSSKSNPTKFPKDYQSSAGKGPLWQGFFMEDLGFVMSDKIGTVFGAGDTNVKPMYQYSYGPNGEIRDSSEVAFTKQCLGFRIANTIIDAEGFTTDIQGINIVDASTKDAGSWAFSIDTIGVKVLKGKFNKGYIVGTAQVPLLTGRIGYNCTIATDSLTFGVSTRKKDTLGFDLWLAKLDIQNSYFNLRHKYEATAADSAHPQTSIDLKLNGKINIDFSKLKLPINFSMVKFENFTLRNFKNAKDTNVKRIGDSNLWFYMGDWAKASPQHYLTSNASNGDVFSGSIGGFTFSVQTIKPITGMDGTKVKLGFATAIKVGFKTGPKDGSGGEGKSDAFSLDAGCGFKVWGKIDYKTWDFSKDDIGGSVDSVTIETDCFSVFKLKGKLVWIGNENPDPTFGEGMFGTLDITIMDKLEIAMAAAFGTVKKNDSEFKWWMFQGAASGFEIPVPPVVFTGFGGGFAYNMTVKPSATLANAKAHNLISGQDGGSLASKMVSGSLSQCEFIPEKDSWVAKAGLSLALANKKLMNADGILTLRVSEGKFSGILIDVSTYILTSPTGDDPAQPAEAKNSNTLIKARALLGYEQTKDYHYFKFALCVKGGIDLSDLLKNSGITKALDGVKDDLKCIGDDVYKDVTCTFDPLTNVVAIDSTAAKAADPHTYGGDTTNYKPDNGIGAGISFALPIEFEVKSYKKGNSLGKKPGAEWYFCIGKPTKGERVEFSMWANLVVFETRTDFTFYFLTGNSFEYHLPELDPEVHEFFFGGSSGKQVNSSATSTVQSQGQSLENQYKNSPTFANAGGFAMGMTYKSRIKYELFLYVDVMAAFGFDVALLDTKGQSCEGYDHVGKNDFYAMGQLYAMLKGSAGLSINLGFWKGKLELCSLGIGALLKGGGPNPSWAFGLLRLKASLLNGLISINTSVDFRVGHVCVPGAGDPLANVNFFESVSPGYKETSAALKGGNEVSPIGGGVIVSNMPWNQEITLVTPTADGKSEDSRKFIFVMEKDLCYYKVSKNGGVSWEPRTKADFKIEAYPKDNLIQTFENKDGGFEEKALQEWHFAARAFEYRTAFDTKNKNLRDTVYDHENNFVAKTTFPAVGKWGWYNPKYASDKDSAIHVFRQDTTIYFNIDSLPSNLYNQVIYSWPYNGDPSVPRGEVPDVTLFLARARPELFDQSHLKNVGKEMQCFIIKGYGGLNQNAERCMNFSYSSNNGLPTISVDFPRYPYLEKGTPYMLRFILVDIDKAQGAIDALMATQQVSTRTDYELTSQHWDQVYASHRASTSTGRGEGAIHIGDFTAFTNARIEALNDKIQHEAGLANIHDRLTPGGHLGDLFGGSGGSGTGGVLGGSGSGTGTGGGLLGGGGDPTITNPGNGSTGTLGRPGRTGVTGTGSGRLTGNVTTINPGNNVQLTNTSGVMLTNSANLSSGVMANNNLNLDMLGMNMGSDAKNMGSMGRLRNANANTNNSSGSGQLYAQYGGQTQQQQASATLSTGNRGGQSQETTSVALVDRNSRNVVKGSSSSTLSSGRVVAATTSSPGRGKIQATNVLVESSSVTLPVAGTATSSGFSALGSTNRVVAGEGNQPGKFLGYNVADYTETYTQAEANVEDYMYEKLKEDYTEQGSDTAMLYERTGLEEYSIAYEYGDTIFDFCFKTDPIYETYEELFSQVLACYNSSGMVSPTAPTANNTLVEFTLRTDASNSQRFGWYSYLFAPQVPNDPTRYNENVTLPAIATFKLNTDKEYRTAAMAKHLFLMSNFERMLFYSNRYTNGPITRVPHQITHWYKDDEFKINGSWDDISCAYGSEFFNGDKGGIIREPSNKWKNLDKRSSILKAWAFRGPDTEPFSWGYMMAEDNPKNYLDNYDRVNTWNMYMGNAGGNVTYNWSYWHVPDILDVTVENAPTKPVITIHSFESNNSKWEDHNGSRNAIVTVRIKDYATPAMYADIQMFYKFFKKCTEVAAYPLSRGYSHKVNILRKLYKEEYANARLSFDDNFPYIINMSLPWTHYFIAWSYVYQNGQFDPSQYNPEEMHPSRSRFQFYSWLWFHYKKAPTNYGGTRGLKVDFNANNDRVLPYWYSGMNNMGTVTKPNVKVAYVRFNRYTASQIANQNKKNLYGSGEINDNSFLFTNEVNKTWQLKNYPDYFLKKDKDTEKLPFPDPDAVESYITD